MVVDPTKSERYVRFHQWWILFMARKSLVGESHRWHGFKHCRRRLTICTIHTNGGIERALMQYRHPKLTSRETQKIIILVHLHVHSWKRHALWDSRVLRAMASLNWRLLRYARNRWESGALYKEFYGRGNMIDLHTGGPDVTSYEDILRTRHAILLPHKRPLKQREHSLFFVCSHTDQGCGLCPNRLEISWKLL